MTTALDTLTATVAGLARRMEAEKDTDLHLGNEVSFIGVAERKGETGTITAMDYDPYTDAPRYTVTVGSMLYWYFGSKQLVRTAA